MGARDPRVESNQCDGHQPRLTGRLRSTSAFGANLLILELLEQLNLSGHVSSTD